MHPVVMKARPDGTRSRPGLAIHECSCIRKSLLGKSILSMIQQACTNRVCGFLGAGITSSKDDSRFERDLVEESESGNCDENRTRVQLPLVDEIDLVSTDLFLDPTAPVTC